MEEKNDQTTEQINAQNPEPDDGTKSLGEAEKSLAGALKLSFVALKIIMLALVLIFLASGFFTVGQDEQALVLRFGKIVGIGEDRLLGPGLHSGLPYPIHEVIKIPVKKEHVLSIDSFWYYESAQEKLGNVPKRVPKTLVPGIDGYCLIRSEPRADSIEGLSDNDYSIVHSKWQLTYRIDNPELFFRNVYIEDTKTGESFADAVATSRSLRKLLKDAAADAIVVTMVNYTIDEAIVSEADIAVDVKALVQERLEQIETGIKIESVQLTAITWPRQNDSAFIASVRASQGGQKVVREAVTHAENILSEAGGPVVYELLAAINAEKAGQQVDNIEQLWKRLSGKGQKTIADARAYRTKIVESAKANADYLQRILPEYRKRPKLVIQKIYSDAIEEVLKNTEENIIIQPSKTAAGTELRILLNRDSQIKKKATK